MNPAQNRRDFADFLEPFCAGWNAHVRHGDDLIGAEFMRVVMEAYEQSGSRLAQKVTTGELTEEDARALLALRDVPECESSSVNTRSPFGV